MRALYEVIMGSFLLACGVLLLFVVAALAGVGLAALEGSI